MNAAADETFEFQVRDLDHSENLRRIGPLTLASCCVTATDGASWQQRLDYQERPVAANCQQKGGDSGRGHLLQQKRWEAVWRPRRAVDGGKSGSHGVLLQNNFCVCFGVTSCSLISSGFDSVPGLVRLKHGHLWQDEQAGEPQGHCAGHGSLPRQVSGRWDPEHPGG